MKLLLNSGLAASCSQANTRDISNGRKERVALCRRLATWGEGGFMSKSQFLWGLTDQGAGTLKGEFQGCICRGRGLRTEQQSALEIGHQWSDQHHLVLSTVGLQFQGQFFPFFLAGGWGGCPVLRILAAYAMGTVWSLYS